MCSKKTHMTGGGSRTSPAQLPQALAHWLLSSVTGGALPGLRSPQRSVRRRSTVGEARDGLAPSLILDMSYMGYVEYEYG